MAHPRGNNGDVSLDELDVVVLGSFGNIWTGEAKNSVSGFFSSGQTLPQREVLQTISAGFEWSGPSG